MKGRLKKKNKIIGGTIIGLTLAGMIFSFGMTTDSVIAANVNPVTEGCFGDDISVLVTNVENDVESSIDEAIAEKEAQEEAERIAQEQAALEAQYQEVYVEPTYYENGSGLNPVSGVNYHNGWRETYYSSNVLYHYRTPEWTVDENGVYRDSEGYVVVASSSDAQGDIVDTSFGAGKIYDTGCAAGTHDIYTNW